LDRDTYFQEEISPTFRLNQFTYDNSVFLKTQVDERGVTAPTHPYNGISLKLPMFAA
jgi:hypothetical protein